jgi:hypothetical protein
MYIFTNTEWTFLRCQTLFQVLCKIGTINIPIGQIKKWFQEVIQLAQGPIAGKNYNLDLSSARLTPHSQCLMLYCLLFNMMCLFCMGGTRIWIQGLILAKQALYDLSHTSSPSAPFFFFFWPWVIFQISSCFLLLASLGLWSSYLCLHIAGWLARCCVDWDGGLADFFAWAGFKLWPSWSPLPK